MNCYCSHLLDTQGFAALDILFDENRTHCLEWYAHTHLQNYTVYTLAIFISIVNLALQISLDWIGKLNKSKNQSASNVWRMTTIFIAQYINTAVVFILVYHNFGMNNSLILDGPFDEFDVRWYAVIGVAIATSVAI